MDISIRELTLEDLEQFRAIRLEMLAAHPRNFGSCEREERQFHSDKWIARINKPNTTIFGVFKEKNIIGLCVLSVNPRRKMSHIGIINSFYIKERYRRQGIASTLLQYVEEYARNKQLHRLQLSVMELNKEAISLYLKYGFTKTGKEVDTIYYEGVFYSLLLFSKLIREDGQDTF